MKKTLLFVALVLSSFGFSQCFDTGSGSDGAYVASTNTTLAGGTYNFTSFTINAGVVVTVTGTAPLEIYCQGTLSINGTLSVKGGNGTDGITNASEGLGGAGVAGGGNGGNGSYSTSAGGLPGIDGANTGGANTHGLDWCGGGGAGYGTAGQASGGGTGGFAGSAYGTADLAILTSGSGGGGGSGGYSCGSGGGGAGGGIIVIHATSINIPVGGLITADGGNGGSDGTGNCGGGGAGSGGAIWIETPSLTNDGTISALGGAGGVSTLIGAPYYGVGGNGAIGRIRIDASTSGVGTINPAAGFLGAALGIPVTYQVMSICAGTSVSVGSNVYTSSGSYSDTLVSAAGCDSIVETGLTVLPANQTTQSFTICDGESVTVGASTYTTSGTFTDVLVDMIGCDSTVVTTVNVDVIDVTVSQDFAASQLIANSAIGTYQWLDCNDGLAPMLGETNQALQVFLGTYAVVVTVGNCSDTSACIDAPFWGLDENPSSVLSIHPNPSNGIVFLKGIEKINGFVALEIVDARGQIIAHYTELQPWYDLSNVNSGIYFMKFYLMDRTETIRLIKE